MTFQNAPWALDGAQIASSLARLGEYSATAGAEGIISKGDLKVSPLSTPGNGVIVAPGGALLLNRYQTSGIDQTYVVSNVGDYTFQATEMPPVSGSAQSHLVCVTIGDPEFSQVGHPWMTASDPAAGTENTFQYVRPFILTNVPSNADMHYVAQQNLPYPALPLARLDIPANTTTIDSSMIVDLRKLARPRSQEFMVNIGAGASNALNGEGGVAGTWENWPGTVHMSIYIPDWAVTAMVQGFMEGARLTKAGRGNLRIAFTNGGNTEWTQINESAPTSGSDRRGYNIGGNISIPASYRGTTQEIRMEGMPSTAADKGFLTTDTLASGFMRIVLLEEPV